MDDSSLKDLFNSNTLINQALLSQIITEIKQGNYYRCKAMGLSDDILQVIDSLPPLALSELMASPVVWAKITINTNAFMRIIDLNHDKNKLRTLINKAIILNASNKMLADYFGISSNVAAHKRKLLNVEAARGRLVQLTEEQKKTVWNEWKAFLNEEPTMDRFKKLEKQIAIAEKYNLNLCVLNQEIESHNIKTQDDHKLYEQLIELRASKQIISNFFNAPQNKIIITQRLISSTKSANELLFTDCNKRTKDKVIREWNYLLKRTYTQSIHDLTHEHLHKLISFSKKYHIEFNSLWVNLTKGIEGAN
ncbi:DUF2857 domain-containing protein [Entomomonas sp. E2T0]|uniref:DUF2857 domain-containing protein n=1 Tax=Entomomonas sp. E2T0 TaxID=2930213 RepID=UPI00222823BA|nr:DUF2857 domain-containing protein [Entomomonas sp. E2T0]UYZ83108.1 DUF2857 domain-containing protein [Entomomonas sp. E2T0]